MLEQATKKIASRLIQRMLAVLGEKQQTSARQVWIPMNYQLNNPSWQKNIVKMAAFFFPNEAETFADLPANDLPAWRALKNRIERKELIRANRRVADEFENDTRFAADEAERWQRGKPKYAELIAGIDFLEPVPGIDY